MEFSRRISTCHRCLRGRKIICDGACPCPLDGVEIRTHARAGQCPADHFAGNPIPLREPTRKIPLAGDIVEALARRLGADKAAEKLARLICLADCRCPKRRDRLNALDRRLRRILADYLGLEGK